MKRQIQLTYFTPEKAFGLRNVGGKTRRFILTISHVIKVLGKFHVLDNTIPQKTEQIQTLFSDHILYQYHTNFYVYHRPNKQPNDMWKKISLMLDSSQKMKVLLAFSCYSTYSDSVFLPGFPLHNE